MVSKAAMKIVTFFATVNKGMFLLKLQNKTVVNDEMNVQRR